jgi:hypothetical protein
LHDAGIVPRESQTDARRAGEIGRASLLEYQQTPLETTVRNNAGGKPQQLTLIEEIPVLEAFIHSLYEVVESTNNL